MKISLLKSYTLTFIGIFFFIACNSSNNHSTTDNSSKLDTLPISPLLKRDTTLGSPKEEALFQKKYDQFVKKINSDSSNLEALLGLTELYIAEARITGEHPYYYPAALKTVNYVLDQNPQQKEILFQAYSLKASVLLSLHEFEKGLKVAEKAVAINPYNANIYGALVDANVELGNYEKAVEKADKMVSIRPDLRSYSRISYLREIHGDVEGSKEAMTMAVKAGYPGYESTAWARYTLAKIYENYGDLSNAEMHYQKTLQERPNYAFAIDGLANIELKKGNLENAEKLAEKAISIIPEVSFYETLASIYMVTNREEKAKEMAHEIISMMKEDEASGHLMDLDKAKVYLDLLDEPDKALKLAEKEYAARPENIDVNLFISQIYVQQEKFSEAKKHLEIAKKTNSQKPELLLTEGFIQWHDNNKKEAQKLFNMAFEKNPYLTGELATEAKLKLKNS